jgi:luciferase family oxidoreductase group 1
MIPFSLLDLAPIPEGSSAGAALRNARDLARHAEGLGYTRFWMAEHHSMPGIASAATAVALGFVAEGTSTIRIGAGGIMLPNHSPLQVAEQFGTLEALYPGRIDLGLGRAPGTDQAAAYAMRRNLASDAHAFPRDVVELQAYLATPQPGRPPGVAGVRAIPGEGSEIPLWILGSSTFGAQLAAHLGLPYAFASHFSPQMLMEAIDIYRQTFRPSAQLARPYLMLAFNVFAADTEEEGQLLATSIQQAFITLRMGTPGQLKPPVAGYADALPPAQRAILDHVLSCSVAGSADTVRTGLKTFIERTQPDELMITGSIFDHARRKRSFEIAAEVMRSL